MTYHGSSCPFNGSYLCSNLLNLLKKVQNCPKQRFALKVISDESNNTETLYIRANQGHSLEDLDVQMKEITKEDKIEECLHGTYYKAWDLIKNEVC